MAEMIDGERRLIAVRAEREATYLLQPGIADQGAEWGTPPAAQALGELADVLERTQVEDLGLGPDLCRGRSAALPVASGDDHVPARVARKLGGGAKPKAARAACDQGGALGPAHRT